MKDQNGANVNDPVKTGRRDATRSQLDRLLALAAERESVRTAIVHPCDAVSLGGALEACRMKLIEPVLVGPPEKIAAAEAACRLARSGEVDAIMKGSLQTDELLAAAIDCAAGLRTDRRMSHVFILDVPTYPRPLLLSDAAINIARGPVPR